MQETFLRAWRRRETLPGPLHVPRLAVPDRDERLPRRARRSARASRAGGEVPWLQPYPDELLDGARRRRAEPDAERRREGDDRARLPGRDPAPAAAPARRADPARRARLVGEGRRPALLDTSVAAVNSALQRARATAGAPARAAGWSGRRAPTRARPSARWSQRYVEASERGDARALADLHARGRALHHAAGARAVPRARRDHRDWVEGGFGTDAFGELRCIVPRAPTASRPWPATSAVPARPRSSAFALDVLRIEDGAIAEITDVRCGDVVPSARAAADPAMSASEERPVRLGRGALPPLPPRARDPPRRGARGGAAGWGDALVVVERGQLELEPARRHARPLRPRRHPLGRSGVAARAAQPRPPSSPCSSPCSAPMTFPADRRHMGRWRHLEARHDC